MSEHCEQESKSTFKARSVVHLVKRLWLGLLIRKVCVIVKNNLETNRYGESE